MNVILFNDSQFRKLNNFLDSIKTRTSYRIYKMCEQNCSTLMTMLWYSALVVMVTIFGILCLFPVLFLIVGYPSPENWLVPITIK